MIVTVGHMYFLGSDLLPRTLSHYNEGRSKDNKDDYIEWNWILVCSNKEEKSQI